MAKWNDVVITDMGMQLSAQTLSGKNIVYTHAQTTDLDLSGKTPDQIQAMTELTSVKQDIPISSISVNDKETVKIFVKITNEGVKQDYMLYGLAVFAKIDDNPEVLYEVVTAQKPDLVPALTGTTLSGINFSLLTHVAKSENASIIVGAGGLNEDEVLELINDHTIDLSNYATKAQLETKVTDLNNGLSTKVTDNKNGTITANSLTYDLSKSGLTSLQVVSSGSFNDLPLGTVFASSAVTDGPDNLHYFTTTTFYFSQWSGRKAQIAIADNKNSMFFRIFNAGVWNSWTKLADDSTVVHTADMRKPASDVAGIEEVSTLQTQVNNSAVGTNLYTDTKNFDNLASWSAFRWWTKTTDAYKGLSVVQTTAVWTGVSQYVQVKKGDILTYSVYAKNTSGTGTSQISWQLDSQAEGSYSTATVNQKFDTVTITDSWQKVSGTAVATSDGYLRPRLERTLNNTNTLQIAGIKVEKGSVATDWCPNPSEILTKADDSKVAHLSGANNFDTTPTVNNNPLLLASSLPSDLARTSQQTNFTGKLQQNGQDVALANNTIARNPNTGVVSEPVDFTKLTVNGGKSVATSDDLKSVEASAWRQLDNKYITTVNGETLSPATNILYKIDDSTHKLYLAGSIALTDNIADNVSVTVKLGSIIKSILTVSVPYYGNISIYENGLTGSEFVSNASKSSLTNLTINASSRGASFAASSDLANVTYDKLV